MTRQKFNKYVLISIISAVIAAPSYMLIKIITDTQLDDVSFMALRYSLLIIACLPVVIGAWPKIRQNWKPILLCNIFIAVSGWTHTPSISLSTASYISVLHLFSPIVLVIVSAAIVKEKLNFRKIVGVAIAFIGAFVMFALPVFLSNPFEFYPEATILSLTNSFAFAFAMILWRKIKIAGVPMIAMMGSTYVLLAFSTSVVSMANNGILLPFNVIINQPVILITIVYLAIIVSLLSHMLNANIYTKVDSSLVSATNYLSKILGILLPVLILRESLSIYMIIGGLVALVGIVIINTKPRKQPIRRRPRKKRRAKIKSSA